VTGTSGFKKFDSIFLTAVRTITALLLALMFVVITLGVIFRYLLNSPIFWIPEFARYVMFYMVLIGSVAALRQRQHPSLVFIIQKFPPRLHKIWSFTLDGLVFFVLLFVLLEGFVLALEEWIAMTPSLRISFFWVYLALPVGALLMMFQIIAKHIWGEKMPEAKSKDVESIERSQL